MEIEKVTTYRVDPFSSSLKEMDVSSLYSIVAGNEAVKIRARLSDGTIGKVVADPVDEIFVRRERYLNKFHASNCTVFSIFIVMLKENSTVKRKGDYFTLLSRTVQKVFVLKPISHLSRKFFGIRLMS